MASDRAACDQLGRHLAMLATAFDAYARAEFEDAQVNPEPWHAALDQRLPNEGVGIDAVTVDPHKWLGAPVGVGATFVKDVDALRETFSQGMAHYLEGAASEDCSHALASLGVPYGDFGVELSAPPRADLHHADDLVVEVLAIGSALTNHEEEHS